MISYDEIRARFGGDYCYTFNLNPDPKKEDHFQKLITYLQKNNYDYWLVKCKSPKGFVHYHGMLKINLIKKDILLTKKSLAKQINKFIGRAVALIRPDSLVAWYRYVRNDDNIRIDETIYKSKLSHDDLTEIVKEEENDLDYGLYD